MTESRLRRTADRYRVTLPVELREGSGTTRDLSARGVYFECQGELVPGAEIDFAIDLQAASLRVRGSARVVRIERLEGRTGIAAEFTTYTMEPIGISHT